MVPLEPRIQVGRKIGLVILVVGKKHNAIAIMVNRPGVIEVGMEHEVMAGGVEEIDTHRYREETMIEITVIRNNPSSLARVGVFLRENTGVSRATSDTIAHTILSTRVGFCSAGIHENEGLLDIVRWFPPGMDMSSVRIQVDEPEV